jgi:hypothetical protein
MEYNKVAKEQLHERSQDILKSFVDCSLVSGCAFFRPKSITTQMDAP